MPPINKQIDDYPIYGDVSLRSTANGRGGGGACLSTITHTAAAMYISHRGDHNVKMSYKKISESYHVSKQSVEQCVKRWEKQASNGDQDMRAWFRHQQEQGEECAAASLVSMSTSSSQSRGCEYLTFYSARLHSRGCEFSCARFLAFSCTHLPLSNCPTAFKLCNRFQTVKPL